MRTMRRIRNLAFGGLLVAIVWGGPVNLRAADTWLWCDDSSWTAYYGIEQQFPSQQQIELIDDFCEDWDGDDCTSACAEAVCGAPNGTPTECSTYSEGNGPDVYGCECSCVCEGPETR